MIHNYCAVTQSSCGRIHNLLMPIVMKNNRRQSGRRDKKEIKVTYISSPVKVKTSASNFRALVQELTGQDSNVADMFVPIEANNNDIGADENAHHKGSTQQWRVDVAHQGYVPDAATLLNLKPADYSDEFLSRSLMEPLNEHLQYELLSFDMA